MRRSCPATVDETATDEHEDDIEDETNEDYGQYNLQWTVGPPVQQV